MRPADIRFVGNAFSPADLARPAHVLYFMWAFRLFPLAVPFYIPLLFIKGLLGGAVKG